MEIVLFLIPFSILLVAAATWTFLWAAKNKQFDDLDSPAHRIIFDDRESRRDQQQ